MIGAGKWLAWLLPQAALLAPGAALAAGGRYLDGATPTSLTLGLTAR